MIECACCQDPGAHVLLACLKQVCRRCLDDMRAVPPKTCLFCLEAGCLAAAVTGAPSCDEVLSSAAATKEQVAKCDAHGAPVFYICLGCGAVRCAAGQCFRHRRCVNGRPEHTCTWDTVLFNKPPPTLNRSLQDRYADVLGVDMKLADLIDEVKAHNDAQMLVLDEAFRGCNWGCGHCKLCPTDAERAMHQRLTQQMRTEGAADVKTLQWERDSLSLMLGQIDVVLQHGLRLAAESDENKNDVGISPFAVKVTQRALTLLQTPRPSGTRPRHISVVAAPRPFGHATRACTAVNRLFVRPTTGVACLAAPKTFPHTTDADPGALSEDADGQLLLITYEADPSGRYPIYAKDLTTSRLTLRLAVDCGVYARLPDGAYVGVEVVGRLTGAIRCVDPADGALRWRRQLGAPEDVAAEAIEMIASPDGVLVLLLKQAPLKKLMGLLADGALHWEANMDAYHFRSLCLVDRDRFGYTDRDFNFFYVRSVHTGDILTSVQLPLASPVSRHFLRNAWPCEADAHFDKCQGHAAADFGRALARLKGSPARPPLFWWHANVHRPLYLHDGRAVQLLGADASTMTEYKFYFLCA